MSGLQKGVQQYNTLQAVHLNHHCAGRRGEWPHLKSAADKGG